MYYKRAKKPVNKEKKWKKGDICIAKYHYDQKWYRGKIVESLGNIVKVNNNYLFIIYHSFIYLHSII